jgi:hypothetical protein
MSLRDPVFDIQVAIVWLPALAFADGLNDAGVKRLEIDMGIETLL